MSAALARYAQERPQAGETYTRETRPLRRLAATRPIESTSPGTAAPEPRSLREFIGIALEQNPEITAAEELVRMRAARVPQVTALPDPMLMTRTLPEPVRTAEGDNYLNLGIQQRFPAPEKLDRAGRVALQETRIAIAALQRQRLNVIADVKRTYFRIYIVDRTIEIDLANQDLLRGLIDAARAQVASGRRRQDDLLRAQVELSNLESQLVELRQQRQSAVAMLNRVMNRSPATPIPTLDEYDVRSVDVQIDALFAAAAKHNPDLQRLKQQLERDRQGVELARLAYWPDLTIGFEWMYMRPRAAFVPPPNPTTGMVPAVNRMSESGTDNWAITLSVNIPLWIEKIEAGIREANSRRLATQHEYVAAKNRVNFEIEDALSRVQAQRELAAIFKDTIIPQAQQAYEVSRASYSAGDSDFLFVIDNWQKWLMFTVQFHRAIGELERSVADLEAAIGLSLSEAGGGT
ncbi:MAG: TolC family protein [Phycisphaerae bacterium]